MHEIGQSNTPSDLVREMQRNNVCGAFAVGVQGVGGYDLRTYAAHVLADGADILHPVAFFDPRDVQAGQVRSWLRSVKSFGYSGVKIHPRLAGVHLDDSRLPELLSAASDEGLAVLVCTYLHDRENACIGDAVTQICRLLVQAPEARVILLHAATTRLLELAEVARSFPNTLLDLSFTLCRYQGSSIDADIAYLFRTFDQRLCIGSDSPQYGLSTLRERFEELADGLGEDKIKNIAYRNIMRFTGLDGADAAL